MRKKILTSALVAAALTAGFLIPNTTSATPASAETTVQTVVPFASTGWKYYRGTTAPASTWKTSPAAWATGTAPLGFGTNTGALGTTLPNTFTTKPLASYFQKSFSLSTVPAAGITLTTWADDGVIVYVNGTEAVRKNLKAGTVTHNTTWATAAPQTPAAKSSKITVTVPASALKVGANLIAAQVQSNWRNTHNVTFDAQLTAATATATTPPTTVAPAPAPAPAPTPAPAPAPSTGAAAAWGTPTWQDNFTYKNASGQPAIDPTKWNVRDRDDLGLLFDAAEPERNQVTVDANGVAHLKADWLPTPVARPTSHAGVSQLTHKTGYMDQRKLQADDVSYSQQYGRWEIRAKTPTGPNTYGALAAFWLRNSNSGEIDIMEAWGYNDVAAPGGQRINTSTTTVHTQTSGSGNEKFFWHHADKGVTSKPWDGFHTYAFELTPTYAAVFVDDVKIATATPQSHPNLWNKAYFGSPLHVRLNLHVGPSPKYWGLPDPAHRDWTQPLDYQVDYVKIWKYNA